MGGDFGPEPNIEAAVRAARTLKHEIVLVGRQEQLRPLLNKHQTGGLHLPIVHASEVIDMDEHPAQAVKSKKDNSISVGIRLLKRGEADAFVTMGNTGAGMAAALFELGRIKGVARPAIAAAVPHPKGFTFMTDIGANAEVKPEYLVQFALMGSIYVEKVLGVRKPKVALLSNGEEDTKGTDVVQQANEMLRRSKSINFIGNVQGYDILKGTADVVICDGFTGNIAIKLMEGMLPMVESMLKTAFYSSPRMKLAGLLARDGIKDAIKGALNYEKIGGAPLLGVDGIVIIGHGRSKAPAIYSALERAAEAVRGNVVETIEKGLEVLPSQNGQ